MNQRPYTIQTIRSADILLDMLTYRRVDIHIDTHIYRSMDGERKRKIIKGNNIGD